jgi:hypothetical protein
MGKLITSEDFSGYVTQRDFCGHFLCDGWGFAYTGNSFGMPEFDLDRQSLGLVPMPGKETLAEENNAVLLQSADIYRHLHRPA